MIRRLWRFALVVLVLAAPGGFAATAAAVDVPVVHVDLSGLPTGPGPVLPGTSCAEALRTLTKRGLEVEHVHAVADREPLLFYTLLGKTGHGYGQSSAVAILVCSALGPKF